MHCSMQRAGPSLGSVGCSLQSVAWRPCGSGRQCLGSQLAGAVDQHQCGGSWQRLGSQLAGVVDQCQYQCSGGQQRLGSRLAGVVDHTSAAEADTQDFARWSRPAFSPEMIDTLRRNAWAGDADAALAPTGQPIGRCERGGAHGALFEAMVWIDRYQGNARLAKSGLIARVQQRDCQHKVLRLRWLCDVPEQVQDRRIDARQRVRMRRRRQHGGQCMERTPEKVAVNPAKPHQALFTAACQK